MIFPNEPQANVQYVDASGVLTVEGHLLLLSYAESINSVIEAEQGVVAEFSAFRTQMQNSGKDDEQDSRMDQMESDINDVESDVTALQAALASVQSRLDALENPMGGV